MLDMAQRIPSTRGRQVRVDSAPVTTRDTVDHDRRARIRAWLDYYKRRRGWTNQRLAEELGLAEPTVTNILNDTRGAGFDTFIRMHDRLRRSADDLLDTDPPPLPGEAD